MSCFSISSTAHTGFLIVLELTKWAEAAEQKYDRGPGGAKRGYLSFFPISSAGREHSHSMSVQFNYHFYTSLTPPFSLFHHQQEWRFDTRAESTKVFGSGNYVTKLNFSRSRIGGPLAPPFPPPLEMRVGECRRNEKAPQCPGNALYNAIILSRAVVLILRHQKATYKTYAYALLRGAHRSDEWKWGEYMHRADCAAAVTGSSVILNAV